MCRQVVLNSLFLYLLKCPIFAKVILTLFVYIESVVVHPNLFSSYDFNPLQYDLIMKSRGLKKH